MKLLSIIYRKILPEKTRIKIIIFIRKIYSFRLRGEKVTCNCCNKSFKRFLPYGDLMIKRENACCPWCSSLERTRMLWDYLEKSNLLNNNNKVLHFAPETVIEKTLLKNVNINYITADINPLLAMEVVDITKIKFSDNSFDVIICSHVISVVKDDIKALSELFRVLKKGGLLILMEHIYKDLDITFEDSLIKTDEERTKLYGQPYLERLYGNDFSKRILDVGFQVEEYDHVVTLSSAQFTKYALQNSGLLFLCKKNNL